MAIIGVKSRKEVFGVNFGGDSASPAPQAQGRVYLAPPGVVTRGRIIHELSGKFLEFPLNPSEIKEEKGNNLSEDLIPGYTDPVINYSSGRVNKLTFVVQLDIDFQRRRAPTMQLKKGQAEARSYAQQVGVDEAAEDRAYRSRAYVIAASIEAELLFLEAFTLPSEVPASAALAAIPSRRPSALLFSFGPRYTTAARWLVDDFKIDVTRFDQRLRPLAAKVNLGLKLQSIGAGPAAPDPRLASSVLDRIEALGTPQRLPAPLAAARQGSSLSSSFGVPTTLAAGRPKVSF